ncbi:MAG: amidohydrolase family protein [Cyclobacteriaceae bacterium]
MTPPFTNIHLHVFNSACAPDRFLMIIPMPFLRRFPAKVKWLLETKTGRFIIDNWYRFTESQSTAKRKKLAKYLSFLDVGTNATQQQVFETALKAGTAYDSSVRLIGLTLNMDYMDSQPSQHQISYETQLEQVKAVKRYYPTNFFPFLGIDPRHKSGMDLVNWAKPYFESGVMDKTGKVYPYFSGIKLYPALGFFPFDPRLDELYTYAEKNHLPVITHCTRSGSQYVGGQIESLIPRKPLINLAPGKQASILARDNIYLRIQRYYNDKAWIKNNDRGENDFACDLFGHPENYIPLLEKFPELKICLAHMGGSDEIFNNDPKRQAELKILWAADGFNWFDKITDMMKEYPNMYTDISYTVADFDNPQLMARVLSMFHLFDKNGKPLGNRALFGTDFFMTEQEKHESELYKLALDKLNSWHDLLTRKNPQEFLMQPL